MRKRQKAAIRPVELREPVLKQNIKKDTSPAPYDDMAH